MPSLFSSIRGEECCSTAARETTERIAERSTCTSSPYLQKGILRDDAVSALNIIGRVKLICILLG